MTPLDPEELGTADAPVAAAISAATTLGPVHLTVADLRRSSGFYESAIGLAVLRRETGRAWLGAGGRELVVLVEEPGAQPVPGATGLFHLALLVPERADLAGWLAHAARERVPLTGASDHFVSEALYLDDPDGHGIEIYWDRPREVWEGQVAERLTTMRLDADGLLGELEDPATAPFAAIAPGTVMGHVHLKVAGLRESIAFYRDVLGLGLMARLGTSAAFLAAGGYHHPIGANTWQSAGGSPPPPGAAALRCATIVLPDDAERDRVLARVRAAGATLREGEEAPVCVDPSGNRLLLEVAAPPGRAPGPGH
jgi:catechol 2,3-dioxygenase